MILDFPYSFPSLSVKVMPSCISFDRIIIRFRHPAVPTAAKLIIKFKNNPLAPVNFEEKGERSFLIPRPTPIEAETAAQ